MTKPMLLAEFTRLPPATRAIIFEGLSGAIDLVAEAAPVSHRFLRYQWFAAALLNYGGQARTILVEHDGDPVIVLPMTLYGPGPARLVAVPGCAVPFRSFPASMAADDNAYAALVDTLAREVNALRLGPIRDDDPGLAPLVAAARAKGWAALDRCVATSVVVDVPSFQAAGHSAFWNSAAQDGLLADAFSVAASRAGRESTLRDWLLVRPGLPAMLGRMLRRGWGRDTSPS